MKKIIFPLIIAALLWFLMFNPWLPKPTDFWTMMTISGFILLSMTQIIDREWIKDVKLSWSGFLIGVCLALLLWGVFWIGDKVATWMFSFARPQVDLIYGMKEQQNEWIIACLLLFIIGPAEEIFWRGFVQRNLVKSLDSNKAFIITTIVYAFVHIWALNFMLLMAALVCGVVWGLAYRLFPKHLFALIVSHAVWDAMVFVIFPI